MSRRTASRAAGGSRGRSDDRRGRTGRPGGPDRLDDLLTAFVDRRRWGDRLESVALYTCWDEVVGSELARRCEPVRLAAGQLVVRAENQAWAVQLRYLADEIRRRVGHVAGGAEVERVQVIVGALQGLAADRRD